jgi:hypothetical protein
MSLSVRQLPSSAGLTMEQTVNRTRWPWLVAAGLGAFLIALSSAWTLIFPVTQEWTPERAQEYREIGLRLHNLTIRVGGAGKNPATREQELAQLESLRKQKQETEQRWEELREELEASKQRGQSTQAVLRWTGAALAVLGMVGWLATRESQ